MRRNRTNVTQGAFSVTQFEALFDAHVLVRDAYFKAPYGKDGSKFIALRTRRGKIKHKRVDPHVHAELRRCASILGMTLSELVREGLRPIIQEAKYRRLARYWGPYLKETARRERERKTTGIFAIFHAPCAQERP